MRARRTVSALALAVALLAMAGCATSAGLAKEMASEKIIGKHRSIVDTVGDERVRIDLPTAADAGKLAVWFHGQGGDENQRMNQDWLNTLRDDGWYVASGTTGRTSWGNAASVAQATELVEWAERKAGVPATMFIAGSMGAATSLGAMAAGDIDTACWYGVMPVVDLGTVSNVPGAETQIAAAWSGAQVVSPIDLIDNLPSDVAYRIRYSPDDTWVSAVQNAEVLASGLTSVSATVSVSLAEGEHGDPTHFDSDDLSQFATGC